MVDADGRASGVAVQERQCGRRRAAATATVHGGRAVAIAALAQDSEIDQGNIQDNDHRRGEPGE